MWVIARSNVGVKNIARSLFENKTKVGKPSVNFKLIVSKEFHFEWCAPTPNPVSRAYFHFRSCIASGGWLTVVSSSA